MNNLNKGNIKVKKYNSATKLLIGLHIGFLLICAIFLSLSLSMLSDSKTATGSVTFDLESPSIALDSGLQLNYNGQVGSSGTLTYTNDAGVETDINNLSLNLTIPQENMFNQYYVKLIYDFSAVNVGTITFGANNYTLTSGQMSAMTTTGTTNEYYSISGTTNSPQALAKDISLNIFEFLKQFTYAHTEAVDTTFNFNIAIIVDTASSCQSTNRSQTVINGKICIDYVLANNVEVGFSNGYTLAFEQHPITTTLTPINVDENDTITIINSGYLKIVFDFKNVIAWGYAGDDEFFKSNYSYFDIKNSIGGYTEVTMETLHITLTANTIIAANTKLNMSELLMFYINNATMTSFDADVLESTVDIYIYYSDNLSKLNNVDYEQKISGKLSSSYAMGCCVTGDSLISIGNNGEVKKAEDIVVGDYVLSYNQTTQQTELNKVTEIVTRYKVLTYQVKLKDGTMLEITPDHPMLTDRGWVCINGNSNGYDISPDVLQEEGLKLGDNIKTLNGYQEVIAITKVVYKNPIIVYNFEVENAHNFFANNMLVHNISSCMS